MLALCSWLRLRASVGQSKHSNGQTDAVNVVISQHFNNNFGKHLNKFRRVIWGVFIHDVCHVCDSHAS